MSNNEYLSQEEIDALLKKSDEESAVTAAPELMTEIEMDALGEIGNISLGSAATALSTLLGQKVEITTPKVTYLETNDISKEFPQPHVAVNVDYVDGFQGTNMLVIKTYDAQVIADLMMGGNGHPEDAELSEFHISAVQEAMNQMMGSAATSMSTIFNRFVNIGPPGVNVLDFESPNHSNLHVDEVLLKVSFRLKIGDLIDSNMMQLIPISFGKYLVSLLMGNEGETPEPILEKTGQAPSPVKEQVRSVEPAPPPVPTIPTPQPSRFSHVGSQHSQPAPQRNVQVQPVQFASFEQPAAMGKDPINLNLLLDIPLKVTVELGRTSKLIREILEMSQGSIIELDKLAGEPVDILVNNKLIAKGEVVVIEENFGVRVTDIISKWDRVQKLQ